MLPSVSIRRAPFRPNVDTLSLFYPPKIQEFLCYFLAKTICRQKLRRVHHTIRCSTRQYFQKGAISVCADTSPVLESVTPQVGIEQHVLRRGPQPAFHALSERITCFAKAVGYFRD